MHRFQFRGLLPLSTFDQFALSGASRLLPALGSLQIHYIAQGLGDAPFASETSATASILKELVRESPSECSRAVKAPLAHIGCGKDKWRHEAFLSCARSTRIRLPPRSSLSAPEAKTLDIGTCIWYTCPNR